MEVQAVNYLCMLFFFYLIERDLKVSPLANGGKMEIYNDNFLTPIFPSGEFYLLNILTVHGYKVGSKNEQGNMCICICIDIKP